MKCLAILLLSSVSMVVVVACEKQVASPPAVANEASKVASDRESQGDVHDHAPGECDGYAEQDTGHVGHEGEEDVAHDVGHTDAGTRHTLGSKPVGDYTVDVTQLGDVQSGTTELAFEIVVHGTSAPSAVRVVVRATDGTESLKVRADKASGDMYHAHVGELPSTLASGSQVVIEVAKPDGTKARAGFDLG